MLTVRPRGVRTGERALTDEVRFGFRDDPIHAEIKRRDRAVGFLADNDEAFFGAQHVHGLGAERLDAVFLAGDHDVAPK